MSKGFFTDKNRKPTDAELIDIIGTTKNKWNLLFHYLTDDLHLKGELKFYGVNYGWALRFNKAGKSVIALYPNKDCITVQIILNGNQVSKALSSGLSPEIIQIINDTEMIHEGKWIYLNIDENTDIKDIIQLIDLRISVK